MLWTVGGLMAVAVILQVVLAHFGVKLGGFGALTYWVFAPIIAAIQRRPRIDRAAIEASAEGLRIGDALVPREKLSSALLRREHEKTYVLLRGGGFAAKSVDVEVDSDEDADALCRALALDAASTTAEFSLFRSSRQARNGVVVAAVAGLFGALAAIASAGHFVHLMPLAFFFVFAFVLMPLLIFSRRAKLRVGADGIVLREGISSKRFIGHDRIARVRAEGSSIIIADHQGEIIANLNVGGTKERRKRKRKADLEGQAQSIVWRLEKAREAYRALAGDAPQAALALDRGEKSAREWLEQLRAIGAGAGATFRNALLTREQLLRIVESTTAAAKERIAAAAALHDALSEEEKPRIRVAAERCAEPALGRAMVRIATAPSDEELESALEEASEMVSGGGAA